MATEPVSPITDRHTCIDGACLGCLAIIGRLRRALERIAQSGSEVDAEIAQEALR